jgi:phosphoesterase RecJ-like protein
MNKVIVNKIMEKIKQYENIFIFGHVRPDGDCYGSQFGLKAVIEANYPKKHVFVITDNCDYVKFLGSSVVIDDELLINGLSIVVDTSDADRVSNDNFRGACEVIKIDHHDPLDHFGNINYELPQYPACCQIIAEMVMELNLKITTQAARALFVGLVTDTGWFKYRGVTSDTFKCAAFLISCGVEVDEVSELLSTVTFEELKFKGVVIDRLKTKGHFLYCVLTKELIEKHGITDEQASNCVNHFASVEGYPIWALVIENKNGKIRIRIRSNNINIIPLAQKYEGGGHDMAVGAKLTSWNDLDNFINDASKYASNDEK